MSSSSFIGLPGRLRGKDAMVAALREMCWQLACDLRVACPGIVQSFNAAEQTVTVKLAVQERMLKIVEDNQGLGAPVPTWVTVPVLEDVPVAQYGGGGFTVTCPIQAGDECEVVFNDNCFNAWFASGGVGVQEDRRRHDLSDAVAYVGLKSRPNALANYSTTALQVRSNDGTMVMELDPGGTIKFTASLVEFACPVQMDQGLTVSGASQLEGTTTIQSRAFLTHQHAGVTVGSSDTGDVV